MIESHSLSVKACLKELKTSEKGLSLKEAFSRFEKNGPNDIVIEKKISKWKIFFKQFQSPFIYILLFAGTTSLLLNEIANATVILSAVGLNALVGFFQENKANDSLKKLRDLVRHQAIVFRGDRERKIDARQVVVGDIVMIEVGSRLPADGRLIESAELSINESSLTGESYPSKKTIDKLSPGTALPDRKNMVYAGTVAVSGRGRAVITATGKNTEVGKISRLLDIQEESTPLQEKIEGLAKFLATIFLSICALVFAIGVFEGRGVYEMFLVAVALAVSAIPEGLLISMSFILVIGMQRLLKVSALARKLVSAETLGSTTVICSDKTGTLTEGRMEVSHIIIGENEFEEDNPGSRQEMGEAKMVLLALQIGAMCNNAIVDNPEDSLKEWVFSGTPTEEALLKAAYEAGIDRFELEKKEKRLVEKQFDSATKFMATINSRDSGFVMYEKGAPEIVLEKSKIFYHKGAFTQLKDSNRRSIVKNFEKMTSLGFRLIAVAYKDLSLDDLNKSSTPDWGSLDRDLTFVGLIALRDPLRSDAKDTIRATKEAGIRPVIITGDHSLIAVAIGKEIGLEIDKKTIVSGDELDKMDDKELKRRCAKINVYARVSPHHKLRIVNALRARGEVVAMAGDGVNDAPALKVADVGIALGNGSDVAKEASDIILLNNNFKVIVLAVEEGRRILSNLRRVVTYLTSDSFCEIVLITGSILIGAPLPLLPVHILWLNIIHDGMPNFALSFEKTTKKMMKRKPDKRSASLLTPEMKAIIFFVGMVINVVIFAFFFWMYRLGVAIEYLRTLVFGILGVKSLLAIFSLRSLSRPIWLMNPFGNPYLWAAVGVSTFLFLSAIYWVPLQILLSTVPLHAKDWLIIFFFSLINLLLIEGVKVFYSLKVKK